jgi:hypothetical protein
MGEIPCHEFWVNAVYSGTCSTYMDEYILPVKHRV